MRSDNSQSGPCSSKTPFLPGFAITGAKTEPEAPAPTMTMSTFSLVISPPLFRGNVRHVGNAERLIAFHGAIDDIDGVGAQHGIGQRRGLPGPSLDLVLSHAVDELALILRRQLREFLPERLPADIVDRQERAAIVLGKGRAEVENAGLKQRFLRRHR